MSQQYIFSAPGRTELGGNHTDHQNGCVLAAAVDLETVAKVTRNDMQVIRVESEGYPPVIIQLNDLSFRPEEKNSTASLIRGMAASFQNRGFLLEGLDIQVQSSVLPGSGLSSSAAFEVLMGTIFNHLFADGTLCAEEIAQISQFVENVYFGKPCGLMDQMASAVGGLVYIDFEDSVNPLVEKIYFDFRQSGHALCIIDTGADHADLTDEYAAIPGELKELCCLLGQENLRQIPEEVFCDRFPEIRGRISDRALLRAIHIYQENRRVKQQVEVLKRGDFAAFLKLVRESGRSSWMYLQNITPAGAVAHQDVAIALALCDRLLGQLGAYRVHGGGFAGTVQAFVPMELLDKFSQGIESVLGEGSCHVMSIRSQGGVQLQ